MNFLSSIHYCHPSAQFYSVAINKKYWRCLELKTKLLVKIFFALFASCVFLLPATVLAAVTPTNSASLIESKTGEIYAYVGSRTTKERNARGTGINVYRVDPITGNWKHIQVLKGPQENPSYLAFDRQQRFLYSVHGDFSEVSSYEIDKQTGMLSFLNMESTKGKNPVHLVVDPTNKFLVVANYATGSVVVLPVNPDGKLAPIVDMAELSGKPGPHKTQQGSSHPHQVMYDPAEKFIITPDKGLDKVFSFRLDAANGFLIPGTPAEVVAREGAGTRHIAFQPNMPYAYVANELDSSITTYSYNSRTGQLKPMQIIPSIPATYTGNNTASGILVAPSGNFVYVSNRGSDTVGIFAVDQATGTLSPVSWEPSQGKGPRFITFDPTGDFLYAANENSDTIVAFRINIKTGALSPTGQIIKTGSPVCIIFSNNKP